MEKVVVIMYICINIYMFYIMYKDKKLAKNHQWRISEKKLLLGSIIFGGLGVFLGMIIFRHKTNHLSFKIISPLMSVIQILTLIYLL